MTVSETEEWNMLVFTVFSQDFLANVNLISLLDKNKTPALSMTLNLID